MDEDEEAIWSAGHRAALVTMLGHVLRELGYDASETQHAKWIVEREQAVATLRVLCAQYGDNDWPDDLHLSDVITKHLERHWEDD